MARQQGRGVLPNESSTLQGRSFLMDGEAVARDGDGVPVFDRQQLAA